MPAPPTGRPLHHQHQRLRRPLRKSARPTRRRRKLICVKFSIHRFKVSKDKAASE
ncbi:hypothetical protein HMPREF0591_1331 [Mycobacterium parascrofulaceum ATCC BAA-614]|uniref:Uncharacterized protein n=1 Tax=Mycobacterium parascrofulaceum ATCC BAA-614 TaxID=525368 RepID=D5P587_9MYCO|nr:hypothetical protein HMPREF0591_1331 [Mycobacterium parascrofulaceum ATCC BAA-614]